MKKARTIEPRAPDAGRVSCPQKSPPLSRSTPAVCSSSIERSPGGNSEGASNQAPSSRTSDHSNSGSSVSDARDRSTRGTAGPIRIDDHPSLGALSPALSSASGRIVGVTTPTPAATSATLSSAESSERESQEPSMGSVSAFASHADPEVLEFCAWLERSCLGTALEEFPHPFAQSANSATEQSAALQIAPAQSVASISIGTLWGRSAASEARDLPADPPFRRYDCEHYEVCLDVAAALDWDNFTCNGCNCSVDQRLLWRARNAMKRDSVAQRCCNLPDVSVTEIRSPQAEVPFSGEASSGEPPSGETCVDRSSAISSAMPSAMPSAASSTAASTALAERRVSNDDDSDS